MTIERKKSSAMQYMEKIVGETLTISNVLLSLRRCEELTQVDFAKLLCISKQTLCDIEKGRKAVSAGRAARFAVKLGYPPAFFIQIALQEELEREGLSLAVSVQVAS